MIARTIQELADAVNVMEMRLVDCGLQEMPHRRSLFRMAVAFAEDVLLASNDHPVVALIRARRERARAFLSILADVREELEAAGVDISAVPSVPFLLYTPAADAVIEAVRAYRRRTPYLVFLAQQHGASFQTSGGVR